MRATKEVLALKSLIQNEGTDLNKQLLYSQFARRVARVGDDVQRQLGPNLLQRERGGRRADHVVAALHHDTRDMAAANGVSMSRTARHIHSSGIITSCQFPACRGAGRLA